ncbi:MULTISPECIES: 3-oxoacyl-ACP reductase [unclassified Limnobacter]|jgi:3-oxoacyl-[acyl-carrier protein] reductase|uniref:3-oxoacyl-ACP reductase n=1 Tax=unclassified Limnobacter TaxID=2630203 RepID=UPI000C623DF9|nr:MULTISPECIES: 3-oxoacyl-ACP reductase [unclassified Limnobacter]MAZ11104.1 3-oxoacyl-ACP reductase [Sutterellaceae bacterium]|tara:strand:+ start:3660 stop:5087 length:1428 start_codon:yes stop_codon:yes gene_type:complete
MADKILEFVHTSTGKQIAAALGLPVPPMLKRAKAGYAEKSLANSNALVGASAFGPVATAVVKALNAMGASIKVSADLAGLDGIKQAAAKAKVDVSISQADNGVPENVYVLDVTSAANVADLRLLYDFFNPRLRKVPSNSRIVVIGRPRGDCKDALAETAQSSLPGFIRSLAKESGKNGTTANLIQVKTGAENGIEGALRFFLSPHSAFVTGQVLPVVGAPKGVKVAAFSEKPLTGKLAVVTGAARGIGAAIAEVLAREGATVIGVDRPADESVLGATMSSIGGIACPLDITDADAGKKLAAVAAEKGGKIDIIVHNAGITRDKMMRNMAAHLWDMVLDVNLGAIVRCNDQLLAGDAFGMNARIVCISSIGGIAGNAGQTNYAATKSAVIGYVDAMAKQLEGKGISINAIAPGFIETQMTAAIPVVTREVARRLSSLSQGGLPVDIAEAVTFMASPLAAGVNGATLRVCGQNLVGA